MSTKSGQRFIKENRAPRVHIEYEVETYGSRQKIELPFVMGVLSDLSGKSLVDKKDVAKRDFVEFDIDNFDERMDAIAPRAAFAVDNTLTGDGKLAVDLTFKSINDFLPGEVVKNVPALAQLLEARQKLQDLLVYMDGKEGAQQLLEKVLKDPALLSALSSADAAKNAANSDANSAEPA
ncbi:type VI secretion system contractile sheath small subunit [Novosphingobium sp.]|jgi:type VI secretion system protein ImpB|uniref:type VI secretion system contractile sheath small subunit n=1 Tax=Novosphingobium sp. TaxID=1874826 RepID=UPI002FDFFE6D